ncbi:hypothetical protein BDV29DRAFT_166455 [Aspergillus leporis]|uniref:Uncharacterized protein n=1 Tax=Aspergillus leporis TaxID=41062 RepID=A0A5N5XDS2_9EURO|nr:hypothetical protein BDV29DRAFT_166455 [Aspergillus leporis]
MLYSNGEKPRQYESHDERGIAWLDAFVVVHRPLEMGVLRGGADYLTTPRRGPKDSSLPTFSCLDLLCTIVRNISPLVSQSAHSSDI